MDQQEAQKLYEIWKNNLQFFVEDVFHRQLTSKMPEFHKEIYGLVQECNRLVMAAPRGFAKSRMLSVFYPIHQAVFQKKKDICIISASEGLAIEWLREIRREIETNPLIVKYFGDLRSGKWTENHLILSNKSRTNIRARGAGGQIRGFRPDLIILDDIETEDSVASSEQRNKLRNWLFKACLNTLLPHGQFLWIGTIISPLALLAETLDGNNGWEKRKYRAYKDNNHVAGNELWGELWSHEKLQERKREIGSAAFASEYLNDPISDETAPIKPSHIRYYTEYPDVNVVITVDPAYSEDENADYKVASAIGIDSRNNRYLLEYIRTHKPSGEFVDSAFNLFLKYKERCTAFGVPDSGTEKEFYSRVVSRAAERNLSIPITPLKNTFQPGGGRVIHRKKDRIVAALQPLFEQGRYFLKEDHFEAVDELLSLGSTRHDDVVDTLCYAEQLIQPNSDIPKSPERDRYGIVIENKQLRKKDYGYDS